jgi:hypothetical protein
MDELGLIQNTIINHLVCANGAGKPVRLDGLMALSKLTVDDQNDVIGAFNELRTEYLKPVFEALQQKISYD